MKNYARELLSKINAEQASKNLEQKLSSLVTDVCNACLGTGALQFCGGETCPECNGTGEPPSEVRVYKCTNCSLTRLESDLEDFVLCSPMSENHKWFLGTVYTKDKSAS